MEVKITPTGVFSSEICFRWCNFCILLKTTLFGRFGGALVKSKNIQPAIIQVNAAKKRLPSQVFVLNLSQFKEAVAATPARASKPCSCRPRPMQLSETFCALCGCVWSACGSESLGSWQIAHSMVSNYHNKGIFSSLRNSLAICSLNG